MNHCLDDRFTLSSDKYNWILIEKICGKKDKSHYFSSINQLSNFVGEYKLRECLVRGDIDLGNKSSLTVSYCSVIEAKIGKLERYIDSIVRDGGDA